MKEIWTIGEPLCEIMRTDTSTGLEKSGVFKGPYASGAPAIFADTVAKLGYESGFIGTIGDDDFGRCINSKLLSDGVDCSSLYIHPTLATGVAFVAYNDQGERTFIFHVGNAASGNIVLPKKWPRNVGIFHVMGCAMMPSNSMAKRVKTAARHFYNQGAVISFDPNIRVEYMRGDTLSKLIAPILKICSVFMPGLDELFAITQCNTIQSAAKKLFLNPTLKVIVLKNGSNGSRIITREEDFEVPVCKVTVKDPTGAGDSFDAGFLTQYLSGKNLEVCARTGSASAALNCASFGPMSGKITLQAIEALIKENY